MPSRPSKQSKSWMVTFRVNAGTERGKAVLDILERERRKNPELTDGDIFTTALLKTQGYGSERQDDTQEILMRLQRIMGFLTGDLSRILSDSLSGIEMRRPGSDDDTDAIIAEVSRSVYDRVQEGVQVYEFDDDFEDDDE